MSSQLFALPQMFLLYPGHEVAQLVDGQLELLHHLVQGGGKGVVVDVGEDIVDPGVLEEILLDAEDEVEDGVGSVGVPVGLLHLLDEHAEGEVELVRPELEDVRLERFLIFPLSSELL